MTVPKNREELVMRNKMLIAGLSGAARANGTPDAVVHFRELSAAFQRGEVTSMAYVKHFRELFGKDTTARLFPELILLLPDEVKREELSRVFDALDRSR